MNIKQKQTVEKIHKLIDKNKLISFDHLFLTIYEIGLQQGIKQEKRRQTIAYNKACEL